MAGKHGFSGSRPPSAQQPLAPLQTRRHIRVGPPANDNVRLGGLRFIGLRWAVAGLLALAITAALRLTGVF